jgi:hypothetical protein
MVYHQTMAGAAEAVGDVLICRYRRIAASNVASRDLAEPS